MGGLLGSDAQYSGSSSYRYVESLINDSADIDIVSPYISSGYARMLARHAARHRVRIITSGAEQNGAALMELGHGAAHAGWGRAVLFFLLLSIISAVLGLYYALAVLAPFTAVLAAAAFASARKRMSNLMVKVSRGAFIHEKLYISERAVISGSANLTYSGMHRNVEHLDVSVIPERISTMRHHFDDMWKSL